MRIAVVGPTHPIKGGVAQHTTVLAQRLVAAGHEVEIVSWLRQYPQRLYPGQQTVDRPEFEAFEPTSRTLSWNRPDSWVRAAGLLREVDLVVFAHITPVQVIPYRTMIATLHGGRARTAVICHNVLPHERGRADAGLVSLLLRGADLIVVHSEAQAAEARRLTGKPINVAQLAPFMPTGFVRRVPRPGEHRRLIFFGLVAMAAVRLFRSQSGPRRGVLAIAGAAGIGILLVSSIVDYPLRMPSLSALFALLCALLLPTDRELATAPVDQPGATDHEPLVGSAPTALVKVATMAILGLVAIGLTDGIAQAPAEKGKEPVVPAAKKEEPAKTISIAGVCRDENGKPIAGAQVMLYREDDVRCTVERDT